MSQVADTKQIKWGEMFSGIGGFRFGLEKANQVSIDSQQRIGNEEGQCESQFEGSNGGFKQELHCDSYQQVWDNDTTLRSPSIEERSKPQLSSSFRCVWANDIDKYACQIYRKHYGTKELVEGDIRTINADAIPDFDLLTAGFPCPSFSLAGKRKGFEDTRGTLFYEVARIAETKRPKLLLLENVKGLLSNDEGRTFAKILQTLDELGYAVEWQVLNSKYFGVPQNRERVFIVGHLRAEPTRQIFPVGQAGEVFDGTRRKAQGEGSRVRTANSLGVEGSFLERNLIASALIQSQGREPHIETRKDDVSHALKGKGGWEGNYLQIYDGHHHQFTEKMGTLTGRENRQGTNWVVVADRTPSYANLGRNLESPKDVTNALSGVQKDNLVLAVETAFTKANMTQGRFSKECHSLDGGKSKAVLRASKIRRLTPVECERLQGFPDDWTEGVSDTQRYKLLGNAVTVNVIEYLGARLLGKLWR